MTAPPDTAAYRGFRTLRIMNVNPQLKGKEKALGSSRNRGPNQLEYSPKLQAAWRRLHPKRYAAVLSGTKIRRSNHLKITPTQ